MPKPLEVKPVRHYPAPHYPSHRDGDPSLVMPYPATPVLLRIAAKAGVLGTIIASLIPGTGLADGLSELPTAGDKADNKRGDAETNQLGNGEDTQAAQGGGNAVSVTPSASPFASDDGLPHYYSPYGTGAPSRISAQNARQVIERVFKQEGFQLSPTYQIKDGPMSFEADGYDPSSGIGYIFADGHNLDTDAVGGWSTQNPAPPTDPKLLGLKDIDKVRADAVKDKRFVAVISQFDRRFEYESWRLTEEEQLVYDNLPSKKADHYRQHVQKLRATRVLEDLEQHVREYIQWARANGAG